MIRRLLWRYQKLTIVLHMLLSSTFGWILRQPHCRFLKRSIIKSTELHMSANKQIVVIAGPTGVGKSDVAARLCNSRKGMVVSADSVQAFRGVQIGANKPTAAERKETPHILVDVVDATETYNAAEWHRDALFTIQCLLQDCPQAASPRQEEIESDIRRARLEKGCAQDEPLLPVVVGGTMMYLQWLVHGRPDATCPSADAVKWAADIIERYQRDEQWQEAVDYVSSLGDPFATRTTQLSGQDWYRLRRTLEIAFTVRETKDDSLLERLYSGEREGGLESLGYDVRCFFLCPDDRMQHTEVVDRRCEEMIIRGLLKETTDLQLSGMLPDMAARAIGYRQTLEYLQREEFIENDQAALDAYLNDFTTATRRYAKKQMQWFRKDVSFVFVPVSVSEAKQVRVSKATVDIERMCSLPPGEYKQELSSTKEDGSVSVSEQTKEANEKQGEKMKLYQFKRHVITPGSAAFREVMAQADECTRRIRQEQQAFRVI